jgi:hypothetical protein
MSQEFIYHDDPPIFVTITDGRAKLHAYLTGLDGDQIDPAAARRLGIALLNAAADVSAHNAPNPARPVPSREAFYRGEQCRASAISLLDAAEKGD